MKNPLIHIMLFMLMSLTCILDAFAASTESALNSQAHAMDSLSTSKGQALVSGKISSEFSPYYGSGNSAALATGLRNGTTISLPPSQGTQAVTITPSKPMGNGNVFITLSLAQQRLANSGIQPPYTSEQVGASLMGGTFTAGGQTYTYQQGILQMRAAGQGWGQIAQSLNTKLGWVVSSMKKSNTAIAATPSSGITTGAKGGINSSASAKPKTSGSGASSQGITNAAGGAVHGKSGIVTGSGPGGSTVAPEKGQGSMGAAGSNRGGSSTATGKGGGKP